jgi:fructose-specific phosphotransferase system IIB component
MIILAITACPTGIAHTYMAAEQLERTGQQRGHTVKVETQGAMGIENRLTEADVATADALILASDVAIEGRERFKGMAKVLEVPVQLAIRNPTEVFTRLEA